MKKLLLGFGLVVLLSACGTGNEPAIEAEPDTSEQSLEESEVITETEEVVAVVEPEPVVESEPEPIAEPDIPEDDSVVESKNSDMDFSTCVTQQATMAEAILSSGNYKVIPIVDTELRSMVKFCTNDGSVIHACSGLDNTMVVTKSTDREGC
ncbi:hypothetical protein [Psychrobacter aquaticus]|uniref:Uncharacterized protein n=1 Tax=Psychrobacter aquaticus CMS 56 TaxID=1354303 RepID=U4T4V6_9GAMM|nr:hypothetical protein [Psychrobacter aquaticus]ERL55191.1 hypothetical protein M917_1924 [Psychrobacter aquaticus CMS 56]